MAGSAYRSFSTAEEYIHTIRAAQVRAVIPRPGPFHGELARIDFDRLWLQRGADSLPRSMHISVPASRSPIFFLADLEQPAIRQNGGELHPGELVFWGRDSEQYQRSEAETRWAAMSLAPDDLMEAGLAILGREIAAPADTRILRSNPAAMQRLRTLHRIAGGLARSAPDVLAHPEVSNAFEQALIHAMLLAIDDGKAIAVRPGWRHSMAILAKLEDFLAANAGRPLYLTDLCVALGASERTLHRAFREHVGVSPSRYLWLRRMHMTRRALLLAPPRGTTVTSVAMNHGFWELGRFAASYRQLFGEAPTETLRRPPSPVPMTGPPTYVGLAVSA